MAEESTQRPEQTPAADSAPASDHVSGKTVQMHRATASIVHADENVTIRQGGAREIRAQQVTIHQGGAVSIDADTVHLVQGAVGLVRAGDAQLGPGCKSGAVLADTVKLEGAGAQFVLSRDSVELDQSATGILVGQHIVSNDSTALLMFADTVEGNVSVAMDRQSALTFGAAFGAALGLMLGVFGILKRKG